VLRALLLFEQGDQSLFEFEGAEEPEKIG